MDQTVALPKVVDDGMTPDTDRTTAVAENQHVDGATSEETVDNVVDEASTEEGFIAPVDPIPKGNTATNTTTVEKASKEKDAGVVEEEKALPEKPAAAAATTPGGRPLHPGEVHASAGQPGDQVRAAAAAVVAVGRQLMLLLLPPHGHGQREQIMARSPAVQRERLGRQELPLGCLWRGHHGDWRNWLAL